MDQIPIHTPRRYDSIFNVHFDIVHGCQLRCIGCPNSTLKPRIRRIAVEDFARCLRNIDVSHIHTFRLFNYGEPLLHKQLAECVEQIPQQSWKASIVEISTNGQKVYWDNFEEMLKLQVVNRLIISCDGDGTPVIRMGSRTRFLAQYFRYVRRGAVRVEASSQDSQLDPLAFVNADGRFVVVIKARAGRQFTISGLPPGSYAISYTTDDEYGAEGARQTIISGEDVVAATIPGSGVLTVYATSATEG